MSRLALYTFGMLRERADHSANDGFYARNPANFAAAESSEGFIARSGYDGEPGPPSWGEQVYPRFYVDRGDGWAPSTLSLWADLASAMAFSYGGIHTEAMKHGREWFEEPRWPPYVLWWVGAQHVPTWQEAVTRHEMLHDRGPSPAAFDFKNAFDAAGRPAPMDRTALRRKIQENEKR